MLTVISNWNNTQLKTDMMEKLWNELPYFGYSEGEGG